MTWNCTVLSTTSLKISCDLVLIFVNIYKVVFYVKWRAKLSNIQMHQTKAMFLDVDLIIVVVEGWISPERVRWLSTVPPGVPVAARHSPGASVRVSAEWTRGWAPPPALLLPHPGAATLLCTEIRYRRHKWSCDYHLSALHSVNTHSKIGWFILTGAKNL